MSAAERFSINAQVGDGVQVTDYRFGSIRGEYVGQVVRTSKTGFTAAYNGTAARFTLDGRKMGGNTCEYTHASCNSRNAPHASVT